jgi:ribosome-associated protein
MIRVTPTISLNENEIQEEFVRASGPGGQNVNKVSSAVQLRFDVLSSPSLPVDVRNRLVKLAGGRVTEGGILHIKAQRYRTQDKNRQDALEQLLALIREATVVPKARRKTRPTLGSQQRRVEGKQRRGEIKRLRGEKPGDSG